MIKETIQQNIKKIEGEIAELELQQTRELDEHRVFLKGCHKRTGYFEGSPYFCGDTVQTTPCDGFGSMCKKCLSKYKLFLFTHKSWEDVISYYSLKQKDLVIKLQTWQEALKLCEDEK